MMRDLDHVELRGETGLPGVPGPVVEGPLDPFGERVGAEENGQASAPDSDGEHDDQ